MKRLGFFLSLLCLASACASAPARTPAGERGSLELVESVPVETPLNHLDIRDAKDVWPEMIDRASRSIDFAEFYASNASGSLLEKVIQAVERARQRGVEIRFLAEEKFYKTYPETLDRFARGGISVRRFDVGKLMGGVLHAKYFIVDGEAVFLGSQNFDWRSLEHIQELGLRIVNRDIARAFSAVYEQDWLLARGEQKQMQRVSLPGYPIEIEGVAVTPAFSPRGWLPDENLWELPKLLQLIGSAQKTIRVQVLTYRSTSRDQSFPDLEDALKRAANRGVQVELLVSNWSKRKGTIEGLQHLHHPPNLIIKIMNIPRWSGGFIPFARVIHAKYLVVDGIRAWVGTSNWERDYFYKSRNVGVILDGEKVGKRLDAFFNENWTSPLSETVDPNATYVAPRIGE